MTQREVAIIRAGAALLLQYPDEEWMSRLDLLDRALGEVSPTRRTRLDGLIEHARRSSLGQLQQEYVATFDLKRKCCLYLSYYLNGDTRKRGMALVHFKETYRSAGYEVSGSELPDFLPMVLEFAVYGDLDLAEDLLVGHRRGLEVLRLALEELRSPWAGVVEAVSDTLPPPGQRDLDAAEALAINGPPAELVGLAPFGASDLTIQGARS